jgi:putative transposase
VQKRLSKGTGIRLLTVLDEFTRESLCIRAERRLRSKDACLTLESLFKDCGIPMYLRSDNGSEFIACCLQGWLETQGTRPYLLSQAVLGRMGSAKVLTEGFGMNA